MHGATTFLRCTVFFFIDKSELGDTLNIPFLSLVAMCVWFMCMRTDFRLCICSWIMLNSFFWCRLVLSPKVRGGSVHLRPEAWCTFWRRSYLGLAQRVRVATQCSLVDFLAWPRFACFCGNFHPKHIFLDDWPTLLVEISHIACWMERNGQIFRPHTRSLSLLQCSYLLLTRKDRAKGSAEGRLINRLETCPNHECHTSEEKPRCVLAASKNQFWSF